jgi:uncharacterized protein YndB with AHSA1/START domain
MSLFTIKMNIEKSINIHASKEKVWEYITQRDKKDIWSPWVIFEKDCEQSCE